MFISRHEIESVRHTRAQLAKWGVPWPPPKGWKKQLIAGTWEPVQFTQPPLIPYDKRSYIPDDPNPRRSYRNEATNTAKAMRAYLDAHPDF